VPRKTKEAQPGRATPKGGPVKRKVAVASGGGGGAGSGAGASSGRYTAPIPAEFRVSPWWVPAILLGFLVVGLLVILLNYLGVFGNASNVYLFIGLGLIVCGFVTATRWH
jgi:hypothetical protein